MTVSYSWTECLEEKSIWNMGKEQQLLDAAAAGNLSKVEVSPFHLSRLFGGDRLVS